MADTIRPRPARWSPDQDGNEVEDALLAHADVGPVAMVEVSDERMGGVLMAFVVAAAGRQPDPDEIVAWGREGMVDYMASRSVRLIAELPLNATGEVATGRPVCACPDHARTTVMTTATLSDRI